MLVGPNNKNRSKYHTGLTYCTSQEENEWKQQQKGKTKQTRTRNYCTNPLASHWPRTLDWRRSSHRQALSRASAPLSTLRCHMPTFFAAVIQSHLSLKTTPHETHFRPLPFRGTAPKASKFFWRQSAQDVTGRPLRLSLCAASRPNMTCFESLESLYQI